MGNFLSWLGLDKKEGMYEPSKDIGVIQRVPGLGGPGLPYRNPIVAVVRGHGPRGGGENKPVIYNRTKDIRGETPAVLNKLAEFPYQQMLINDRIDSSIEGQSEENILRKPRRIET